MQELSPQKSALFLGDWSPTKPLFFIAYAHEFLEKHKENPEKKCYFITSRKNLVKSELLFKKSKGLNPQTLARISLIFIENGIKNLMDFLLNFELIPEEKRPILLIFEDLSEFFQYYLRSKTEEKAKISFVFYYLNRLQDSLPDPERGFFSVLAGFWNFAGREAELIEIKHEIGIGNYYFDICLLLSEIFGEKEGKKPEIQRVLLDFEGRLEMYDYSHGLLDKVFGMIE